MERNPNCFRLMAMFFLMAALFALRPMPVAAQIDQMIENEIVMGNSPPEMQTIAMFQSSPDVIVTWLCASMPGVLFQLSSISDNCLSIVVNNEMILTEDVLSAKFINLSTLNYYFYTSGLFQTYDYSIKYRLPRDGLRQS